MVALATVLVFAVSAVFAMLGLGGGMLYVPIFHWLGFNLKDVVIPLSLLLNGLNTLVALGPYGRNGLVDWRGGLPMALAAFVFAPLGALVAPSVPSRVLLILFAAAVIVAAIRTLLVANRPDAAGLAPLGRRMLVGSAVSAAAGFIGGLLGVGGGFIIAPLLMWIGYNSKRGAATTAYIVTFSSFSGFIGHVSHMAINWTLFASLAGAVIVASLLGSWFMANKAKPSLVKWLYGVLLLGVAVKLLV